LYRIKCRLILRFVVLTFGSLLVPRTLDWVSLKSVSTGLSAGLSEGSVIQCSFIFRIPRRVRRELHGCRESRSNTTEIAWPGYHHWLEARVRLGQ
jgi:hypothetical protein